MVKFLLLRSSQLPDQIFHGSRCSGWPAAVLTELPMWESAPLPALHAGCPSCSPWNAGCGYRTPRRCRSSEIKGSHEGCSAPVKAGKVSYPSRICGYQGTPGGIKEHQAEPLLLVRQSPVAPTSAVPGSPWNLQTPPADRPLGEAAETSQGPQSFRPRQLAVISLAGAPHCYP